MSPFDLGDNLIIVPRPESLVSELSPAHFGDGGFVHYPLIKGAPGISSRVELLGTGIRR